MVRVIAAVALALLAGCESKHDSVTVTRVYVENEADLRRFCGDDLVTEPLGCARGAGE